MNLWRLFNEPCQHRFRDSRHYLIEDDGTRFEVAADYAETGVQEGWLEVMDMHIDLFEVEHIKYRLRA